MKIKLLLIGISLLTGCTNMHVKFEQNDTADFSAFKTYEWIDGPQRDVIEKDPQFGLTIKQAANAALAQRGMKPALNLSQADLQLTYHMKLQEEQTYTETASGPNGTFSGGLSYDRATHQWAMTERNPDLNLYTIEIGTLTVIAYDKKTGNRVWKGQLETQTDRSLPKVIQMQHLTEATQKLMKRFPGLPAHSAR